MEEHGKLDCLIHMAYEERITMEEAAEEAKMDVEEFSELVEKEMKEYMAKRLGL